MPFVEHSGEVIKHNDVKCILNEGMPLHKNPLEKGKLIITFTVTFPIDNWLPLKKMRQLEELLPDREEQIIPDGADECLLENDVSYAGAGHSAHYQEDSDEEGYAPRVQCASQ